MRLRDADEELKISSWNSFVSFASLKVQTVKSKLIFADEEDKAV